MNDKELKTFWLQFKEYVNSQHLNESDWVSNFYAAKNSTLNRHVIRKLSEDGMIRKKGDKFAMPDIKLIEKFLNYFDAAKKVEIIKETDITGSKKYLMVDFQNTRGGKTVAEHQMSLMFTLFKDLFSNFYDLVPKQDVKIPDEFKTGLQDVVQKQLEVFEREGVIEKVKNQ